MAAAPAAAAAAQALTAQAPTAHAATAQAPTAEAGARRTGRRRRRRNQLWQVYATATAAVALIAGGLAYAHLAGTRNQNWYALGQNFELAAGHQGAGLVTGPVGELARACTADASAAPTAQRPATADETAVSEWVQGCEAGYRQGHPGQLVEDGVMYGNGAKPCTEACSSKWYAAGQSIALAASGQPGVAPDGDTSASAATDWCADLMGDGFSQPLGGSVKSQLRANKPAGPETASWDQGCAAGYRATVKPQPSNSAVTVTGMFGAAADVTFPGQQADPSLYVKTLVQGTGATLTSSAGLVGDYVAYDWSGTTHKLLGSSYTARVPSLFVGKLLPGLRRALVGQQVGSRVLAVIPPADGYGSSGNSAEGIGANDTLVFVVDMVSTFATAGVPGPQTANGGGPLPTVTPPAAGSTAGPSIAIPGGTAPPDTLRVQALVKGTGPVVKKGQDIAVQYTGVLWRTGRVFDSSWSSRAPLATAIGEGQVIRGWDAGLVGQTVGSRVLLVIPSADAYGSAGEPQVGITGTDTLVFVVDILAAV